MQSENNALVKLIINKVSEILPQASPENPIGLHEPDFSKSNAWDYVKDCIDSGWVSSAGEWVTRFEDKICKFTGASHAIAVTNGTVGLRLALHIIGVKSDEEVMMPPLSFIATANAASHLGAFPHFIDIEKKSLGMCANALSERLKKIAKKTNKGTFNIKTKRRISAILPVHVFGIPSNISDIIKISNEWNIPVVEDAAEALGSSSNKIHCGLHGKCGILSFNGNKIITSGGGGVIITNDFNLAEKARHLSTTAKIPHAWNFEHDSIGWNDRMPNLNAALGFAGLEQLDNKILAKKLLHKKYTKKFNNLDNCEILTSQLNSVSNNWLVTLRLLNKDIQEAKFIRDELLKQFHIKGILIRPAWNLISEMQIYNSCQKGHLVNAEEQVNRLLNLPSSPQLVEI